MPWSANRPEYIDVAGGGKRRPLSTRSSVAQGSRSTTRRWSTTTRSSSAASPRPWKPAVLSATTSSRSPAGRPRSGPAGSVQPFGPVENVDRLIPALARPDWDPEQRFSMPWQAGLTGIAYDARRVDRAVGSIDELFTRQDLKGKVGLLTEFSDTVGMALLAQGS